MKKEEILEVLLKNYEKVKEQDGNIDADIRLIATIEFIFDKCDVDYDKIEF